MNDPSDATTDESESSDPSTDGNGSDDPAPDGNDSIDEKIVHRDLDTSRDNPAVEVAEVVAELEGTEPVKLPSTYNCIDHAIDHLFSEPPAPEAQVVVEFTYQGYRISIEQDGTARFVKVD